MLHHIIPQPPEEKCQHILYRYIHTPLTSLPNKYVEVSTKILICTVPSVAKMLKDKMAL